MDAGGDSRLYGGNLGYMQIFSGQSSVPFRFVCAIASGAAKAILCKTSVASISRGKGYI